MTRARLRDDSWRHREAVYPLSFILPVQYADIDTLLHVNNVAIARYFQEGRMDLIGRAFGMDCVLQGGGLRELMMVAVTIEHISQSRYPGEVRVMTGVDNVGTSSMTVAQAAFQNDVCIALASTVIVKACDNHSHPFDANEKHSLDLLTLKPRP